MHVLGFEELPRLLNLRYINVSGSNISDLEICVIAECKTLEYIDISNTMVSTSGVKRLLCLPKLGHIICSGMDIDLNEVTKLVGKTGIPQVWCNSIEMESDVSGVSFHRLRPIFGMDGSTQN